MTRLPRWFGPATLALAAVGLPTSLPAQMQPYAHYQGKLLPIVACDREHLYVAFDGKRWFASGPVEVRPADAFGEGAVKVDTGKVDLDPLKDATPEERAKPSSIRFRYEAEVTAEDSLQRCYAVLVFVANGSIGNYLVPLGHLRAGHARRVRVELPSRVDFIERLHVFSDGMEIRSNVVTGAYDARELFAGLVEGNRGVPAVELCQLEQRYPHELSNDGRLLATIRERDTHNSIIIYDLAAMKLLHDIKVGEKGEDAWDLTWVSDHELAYIADAPNRRSYSQLTLLDVNTGKVEVLYDDIYRIISSVKNQPGVIVVLGYGYGDVWTAKYDVTQRRFAKRDQLEEGRTLFDDDGNERIRYREDGNNIKCFYKVIPGAPWRELNKDVRQAGLDFNQHPDSLLDRTCEVHSIGPDGDTLYISSRAESDRFELAAYSLSQGVVVKTVASHPRYDLNTAREGFSRLLFRKNSSELIGIYYDADKPKVQWIDEQFAAVQKAMDQAFPDHVNAPIDWSETGDTFIYLSYSDQDPGTYYVFRPFASQLIPLLILSETLKNRTLGHTEPIQFAARDGTTLYGYLTSPPEPPAGPAPLVVYIHGGPTARDSWGFDATAQFLATRGYLVLQVNYRGSSG